MHPSIVPSESAAAKPAIPSSKEPDWSREAVAPWDWDPSRQVLRAMRDYQALRGRVDKLSVGRRGAAVVRFRF